MSRCVTRCLRHFVKKSTASARPLFKTNTRSLTTLGRSKAWLSKTRSKSTLYALYHLNNYQKKQLVPMAATLSRRNFAGSVFDSNKKLTFMVGIDGTRHGYLALQHAYRLAQPNDRIIALHIPWDLYQFAYEQLVFSTEVIVTQEQRDAYTEKKSNFINKIEAQIKEIREENDENNNRNKNIDFEFRVTNDSVSIKADLVEASIAEQCDYLVLGSAGYSQSLKESIEKQMSELLGSVPDYCVHNTNCSVIVVKDR